MTTRKRKERHELVLFGPVAAGYSAQVREWLQKYPHVIVFRVKRA